MISHDILHTTLPHDSAIDIVNVCKSFVIARIEISSILPQRDLECQKR